MGKVRSNFRRRKRYILLFFFLSFFVVVAEAQRNFPDSLVAYYSQSPIVLDGSLSETGWDSARHISNFTQRELNVNEPATERTEVAVVYTSKTLYLGIWCYDREPGKIIAKELKRDFDHSIDDNFEIIIDTYHDKRNGFLFVVNPNAAREDAQVLDNGASVNKNWNGVWNAKTTITADGWFAEIEIPFSTLKYRTGIENQVWGINFERNIRRKREQVLWQGWSRDSDIELVNKAGTLVGLDKIVNKNFVEIKPYAIGGAELNRLDKNEGLLNAGGDVNYLVTPTLRLNLTVNTDFAQVESDREQINLTRFPLFFPERREFFLEGEDYFDMGLGDNIIPFYSRRIGLTKNRTQVPIIAGGRLLGKVHNSTLGAMILQTGEEDSVLSANYSVLSWRQDVLEQSTVGAMVINKYDKNGFHNTSGAYGRYSTSRLFGNKNLNIGGSFSQIIDEKEYDQKAHAHRVFISYPNDKIQFDAAWERSPASYNPEVGFLRRDNFEQFYTELEFNPRPKNLLKWIRRFSFKPLDMNYFLYDDNGDLQSFFYEVRPIGFWTKSGEFFEFNIQRRAEGLRDDFEIQDSVIISKGNYWNTNYEIQGSTFRGRALSLDAEVNYGGFFTGKRLETELSILWRASKHFSFNIAHEYNKVDLAEGNFSTNLVNGRIDYAINPNIFGSFFSQWNSEDEEVILNYRLHIIPKIGTDFYFIINQTYDTQGSKMLLNKTVLIGKLIWRFVI